MKPEMKMKVRKRVQEHTGSSKPSKQMEHFDRDEKIESQLEGASKRVFNLVRRMRRE